MATSSAAVTFESALVTLGKFELWIEDRIAPPPPTHKARALLAFLVAGRGHDAARERILEVFWDSFEPERAREGLRTALSAIRHGLRSVHNDADELLFADKSVVRWIGNTKFDVAHFEQLARANDLTDKRAAVRLYGGDFLEGNYEEWAVSERDRIAAIYESVLADLVQQAQDLDASRLLLARNPFHEEAYATLIQAQLDANRPAAAAELLDQHRAAMREMNAEPSAEFKARFAHVQQTGTVERAARHLEAAKSVRVEAPKYETNLPAQLTSFVGRDADLAEIESLVRRSRLVTLVGAGGIGKTRLAIEAGTRLRAEFKDGVWLIDLASVTDPHYIAAAIATAIGVSAGSLERPLQETLIAALQNRRALLVFDNCEHVVAAVVRVAEAILRSCPDVRILATSRERLSAEGEEVFRLSALAESDAIGLFAERARAVDKDFALTDRNATLVASICRRLDGIPLAIELAAPRVSVLSLRHLQSELDRHFSVLTTGSSTALPRHKTVRALIDWSYDLLAPAEKSLLRGTGVFVGGFTLKAAEAIVDTTDTEDAVLDLISSLAAKSLIFVDTDPEQERYRLLQTMQQYALEKLRECEEFSEIRERHAQYFSALMQEADETYGSSNAREWLQRYQSEIDNVRAAIDHNFEAGCVAEGSSLVVAARELWQELGLHAEALHRAQHALDVLPEDAPLQIRAGLWLLLAQVCNTLYLTPDALDSSQRARDAFEALGDERNLAFAEQSAGFALMRAGIHEDAEREFSQAQEMAERQGNRRLIMRILLRRAQNVYAERTLTQSLPLYEKSLQLARSMEDDLYEGYIVGHMADVYFALNDPTKSVALAEAAKAIFQRRKDAAKEANMLVNLAAYHLALGELDAARSCARSGIARAREAETIVNLVTAVQHLAAIAAIQGKLEVAATLLGFVDEAFMKVYFNRLPTEKSTRDKAMEALRGRLSQAQILALFKEGAAITDDQALSLALSI